MEEVGPDISWVWCRKMISKRNGVRLVIAWPATNERSHFSVNTRLTTNRRPCFLDAARQTRDPWLACDPSNHRLHRPIRGPLGLSFDNSSRKTQRNGISVVNEWKRTSSAAKWAASGPLAADQRSSMFLRLAPSSCCSSWKRPQAATKCIVRPSDVEPAVADVVFNSSSCRPIKMSIATASWNPVKPSKTR